MRSSSCFSGNVRLLPVSLNMLWHRVGASPDTGQPQTTPLDKYEGFDTLTEESGEILGRM